MIGSYVIPSFRRSSDGAPTAIDIANRIQIPQRHGFRTPVSTNLSIIMDLQNYWDVIEIIQNYEGWIQANLTVCHSICSMFHKKSTKPSNSRKCTDEYWKCLFRACSWWIIPQIVDKCKPFSETWSRNFRVSILGWCVLLNHSKRGVRTIKSAYYNIGNVKCTFC